MKLDDSENLLLTRGDDRQKPPRGVWSKRAAECSYRWLRTAVMLFALLAVLAQSQAAMARGRTRVPPAGVRDLVVLDQNLYVGTEFTPILTLDPTAPDFGLKLLGAVSEVYQAFIASDFPRRAEALAAQMSVTQPDLVSLQEAALLRTQTPGDSIVGGTVPATDVQLDYVTVLLGALERRGLHYTAVAIVTNLDVELPMPTAEQGVFTDVRLTDRDVILARAGLPPGHLRVRNPQTGHFNTLLPLPGLGTSIARGWCSVDVVTRGRALRFINAHLEENTAAVVQAAQAVELLAGPVKTALPVLLAGDFNSDAHGKDGTTSYGLLTAKLTDAWSVANPGDPGLTWGHDPLLADPSVAFIWRLDLLLYRGKMFRVLDMETFSPQFQSTPPLWPSDHAGVVARFRLK